MSDDAIEKLFNKVLGEIAAEHMQKKRARELSEPENTWIGVKFDHSDGRRYVVTWDDGEYLRATPMDCETGLTSETFRIDEIFGDTRE